MSQSLYSLLERAACRHGNRIAISLAGQSLTYSELLTQSRGVAGELARHGAEPGCRVAFAFHKSFDALVTLMGIIRTGATYVPIDPQWPAERITAILQDSGATLWTGSRSFEFAGLRAALVSTPSSDREIQLNEARQAADPAGPAREPVNDLANILYTSGSTGRPKGVEITATSLLHFARWGANYFELHAGDRIANHAPYNFDLSTFDIFAALWVGATMCPIPERVKMFAQSTARLLADERITVWYTVPTALAMVQEKLAGVDISSLRHLIFAGEVMGKPTLKAIAQAVPQAELTNLYGPTETNVCTYYRVQTTDLTCDAPLPIGWPIDDTRLWIVAEDGVATREANIPGELVVAGPTVTTGYVGDVALTKQRLVPAPDGIGAAYRTGDRVSRRDDGAMLFQGRIDRMIKCRGHRIEPGEIEAALLTHPDVKDAAIVPLPDAEFGNLLRACVSMRSCPGPSAAELTMFARNGSPVTWCLTPGIFLTTCRKPIAARSTCSGWPKPCPPRSPGNATTVKPGGGEAFTRCSGRHAWRQDFAARHWCHCRAFHPRRRGGPVRRRPPACNRCRRGYARHPCCSE